MNQSDFATHSEKAKNSARESFDKSYRTLGNTRWYNYLPKFKTRFNYHRGVTKRCNKPKQTSVTFSPALKKWLLTFIKYNIFNLSPNEHDE